MAGWVVWPQLFRDLSFIPKKLKPMVHIILLKTFLKMMFVASIDQYPMEILILCKY